MTHIQIILFIALCCAVIGLAFVGLCLIIREIILKFIKKFVKKY